LSTATTSFTPAKRNAALGTAPPYVAVASGRDLNVVHATAGTRKGDGLLSTWMAEIRRA